MNESSISFTSRDGLTLHAWRWAPAGTPRAAVQIHHGLAEHGARYRCFGHAACGFVPQPFKGMDSLRRAADPAAIAQVRKDLPLLILSGDADPVAGPGGAGVQLVGQRYRDAGPQDVKVRLYPQARHELLNGTNREEVTAELLGFLDRTVGR